MEKSESEAYQERSPSSSHCKRRQRKKAEEETDWQEGMVCSEDAKLDGYTPMIAWNAWKQGQTVIHL